MSADAIAAVLLAGEASPIPLADTRDTIADYVGAVFLVYLILIIIRVLLSWVPRLPYNRALRAVVGFVEEVTNPYLNVFRRFLPPVGGGGFALDLSPILAIILLFIARSVVVGLIRG
jgi:YggT family protein